MSEWIKKEEAEEQKPDHTFNLDSIELTTNITDLRQEGNYLIGTTDKGVTFRQRIPQGKILNMANGKYILQNTAVL